MAELRSFIIGVTIAGAVLLIAGLAFGLFGEDSSGSPSVRLLGTPPPSRTPPPPATRDPSELTPVLPSPTPGVPTGATGPSGATGPTGPVQGAGTPPAGETQVALETPASGETPNPIQTATPSPTPTVEVAPTEVPPTPTPEVNQGAAYAEAANPYATGLGAQVDYLAGLSGAPNVADPGWQQNATSSANDVITRAAGLGAIAAPGCVSAAHSSLVAAANQASSAANAVLAGITAQDAGAISAQSGSLSAASGAISSAIANVNNTVASSC